MSKHIHARRAFAVLLTTAAFSALGSAGLAAQAATAPHTAGTSAIPARVAWPWPGNCRRHDYTESGRGWNWRETLYFRYTHHVGDTNYYTVTDGHGAPFGDGWSSCRNTY